MVAYERSQSCTRASAFPLAYLPCYTIIITVSIKYVSFLYNISGLVQKVKHKELLRRVHLVYPTVLPERVVRCIEPDVDELSGFLGTTSKTVDLSLSDSPAPSIIFNIHLSSDGVTPFKTEGSSIRCIMGSIDSLTSPHLGLTIPVPDAPPFIIGVYKGQDKKSDLMLQHVVNELLELSPDDLSNGRSVYCRATAWIADAVERSAICGTIATAGIASCPRCEQEGKTAITLWQQDNVMTNKRNHVYFPLLDAPKRTQERWPKYLKKIGNEVMICFTFKYTYIRMYLNMILNMFMVNVDL